MNAELEVHATTGEEVLDHYAKLCGDPDECQTEILTDLLADLMHTANKLNISFDLALIAAYGHFDQEKQGVV